MSDIRNKQRVKKSNTNIYEQLNNIEEISLSLKDTIIDPSISSSSAIYTTKQSIANLFETSQTSQSISKNVGTIYEIYSSSTTHSNSSGTILIGDNAIFNEQYKSYVPFNISDYTNTTNRMLQKGFEVEFDLIIDHKTSTPIAKNIRLTTKMEAMIYNNTNQAVSKGSIGQNTTAITTTITSVVDAESTVEVDSTSTIPQWRGTKANILWRAIDMDDLRLHPLYHPLPHPSSVLALTPTDFALFRQDSWQWDALHQGRLTTSKAAACLGMYEDKAGKSMMTPKGLLSHSRVLSAYEALLERAPDDWSFLNKDHKPTTTAPSKHPHSAQVWRKASVRGNKPPKFIYTHHTPTEPKPVSRRYTASNPSSARLMWGSAQESTAILAVLNYLATLPSQGSYVSEVGLLASEALSAEEEPLLAEWIGQGDSPLLLGILYCLFYILSFPV